MILTVDTIDMCSSVHFMVSSTDRVNTGTGILTRSRSSAPSWNTSGRGSKTTSARLIICRGRSSTMCPTSATRCKVWAPGPHRSPNSGWPTRSRLPTGRPTPRSSSASRVRKSSPLIKRNTIVAGVAKASATNARLKDASFLGGHSAIKFVCATLAMRRTLSTSPRFPVKSTEGRLPLTRPLFNSHLNLLIF